MKEVNSEKIKVNLKDVLQKYSKEELATICQEISHKVCDKADELVQLFNTLRDAYPEIFGLVDFSLICTFTAAPFADSDPPFLNMQGTQQGVGMAAQGIIKALQEIA